MNYVYDMERSVHHLLGSVIYGVFVVLYVRTIEEKAVRC